MIPEKEYFLRGIDELDTDALFFVDSGGIIRYINKGVTTLLGYSLYEAIGQPIEIIIFPDAREAHRKMFRHYTGLRKSAVRSKSGIVGTQRYFPATVDAPDNEPIRFICIHKNQHEVPITLTINEVWADEDDLIGFVAIIRDNTEQHILQHQLKYRATYSEHTGLINRAEFERVFQEQRRKVLQGEAGLEASILYADVDYFRNITYRSSKRVNYVLKLIAIWLLNNTRSSDGRLNDSIVSHYLGDKFLIYLPKTSLPEASKVAGNLQRNFLELNLGTREQPYFTSLSIGVACVKTQTRLQDAISKALNACRVAKEKGKNRIRVAQEEDTGYLRMESLIREGLRQDRLMLYAQKIVPVSPTGNAIDKRRMHYEVLSRLKDKHGEIISPVVFIPAAEKLGIAPVLDRHVIRKTLALLKDNPEHVKNLSLCSINLSGMSASDEQMLQFIEREIRENGVDPRKLCFEVTETSQIQDNIIAETLVTRLRELGCSFAFDDFGIGYSNYQSFSRIPVDIIKIDGSYVRRILTSNEKKVDVEGMINSAKARGLTVVAEYVESEEIAEGLRRIGADYAQGYHYSKPIPLEDLIAEGAVRSGISTEK